MIKIGNKFPALILLVFFGCKDHKTVTSTPVPTPVIQAETNTGASPDSAVKPVAPDPVMAFIVSFYSIGSGIDRGMPEKLKSFVDTFSKKINTKIDYAETHWGREGETDYCFSLKGLPDSEVSDFKAGAKDALKTAEHVHFIENQACRKGR